MFYTIKKILGVLLLVHSVACSADFKRTVVFIKVDTDLGEDVFLRGGNSKCSGSTFDACAIPIRHNTTPTDTVASSVWSVGDHYLDWQGAEQNQALFKGIPASGSPMIWTTSNHIPGNPTVDNDGFGYSHLNTFGSGYWMLDVEMDCSQTDNGWFQFKTYITPTAGWGPDVDQSPCCGGETGGRRPSQTNNHQARCGSLNLFVYGSSGCVIEPIQFKHPTKAYCGAKHLRPTRVVNGKPASEGSWPWMSEILYKGHHGCGAVLISPTWAITAGHCVRTAKTYGPWTTILRTGETNRHSISGRERDYFVKNIIKHPLFDQPGSSVGNDHDIALLELTNPVTVNHYDVTPACIPTNFYNIDQFTHEECWIIGWGSTRDTGDNMILQELQVNVSSVSTCGSLYGSRVSDRQVCAGNGTKQACLGDSGSPLSCKVDGIWYVVGVVSWGDDNCIGRPSVFTRISQFIPWIQQHTGLHFNQNSHVIG